MQIHLSPTINSEVASFWATFSDDVLGGLKAWGTPRRPVLIQSVESFDALNAEATAPVDGLLYGLADLSTVTILAPSRWPDPPDSATLKRVLTHELAHVILFQRCGPPSRTLPVALATWFREGMAVLASDGAPTIRVYRNVGDPEYWLMNATADAARFAVAAEQCYHVAHLLFYQWFERYGARKLARLCREMRDGASFAEAFHSACETSHEQYLNDTLAALCIQLR